MPYMLVIATTVWMLHRVLGRTPHLGQQLRFTLYLWKLLPALSTGLSIRPPPAAMPMTPRHVDGTVLREPDGKRIRVFLPSSECPMIMQEQPPARAIRPRSD